MQYVKPAEEELKVPQGEGWRGQKIQKLFSQPATGNMTIYSGEVTDFLVTRVGQERVHIVYEDGDNEICEASTPSLDDSGAWCNLVGGLQPHREGRLGEDCSHVPLYAGYCREPAG